MTAQALNKLPSANEGQHEMLAFFVPQNGCDGVLATLPLGRKLTLTCIAGASGSFQLLSSHLPHHSPVKRDMTLHAHQVFDQSSTELQ